MSRMRLGCLIFVTKDERSKEPMTFLASTNCLASFSRNSVKMLIIKTKNSQQISKISIMFGFFC